MSERPTARPASGYTPIPGSAALRTGRVGQDAAAPAEQLEPSSVQAVEVEGHTLGRVLVREGFVPVLRDVFDRLALQQGPLEQLLYLHLYRLALGEERNHCRVSRAELGKRTQLSDRRLMKALAALVDKGHVALVSRDRRGTLYRVLLPHEVFEEGPGDAVQLARPRLARPGPKSGPETGPTRLSVATEPPVASAPARRDLQATRKPRPKAIERSPGALTVGSLAATFIATHGERPGRARADVVDEILGRLEEGIGLQDVQRELDRFAKRAPKTAPLSALRSWLESDKGM